MSDNTATPVEGAPAPVEGNETEVKGSPETIVPGSEGAREGDNVQKAAAQVARKLKLKVDGLEQEYDEADVIKLAQMGKSAQKRFNEAAQARKEAQKMLEDAEADPRKRFKSDQDAIKWAEELLMKEIEKNELSPEAKRAYEAEQEVARLKKEQEDAKTKEEHEASVRLQAKYTQQYEAEIQGALEETQIPKTADSVARMASLMHSAIENGYEITAVEAAGLVKQNYLSDIVSLLGAADGEMLLSLLGEESATKIRKVDLARLESAIKAKNPEADTGGESAVEALNYTTKEESESEKVNSHEWRERMAKIYNESD